MLNSLKNLTFSSGRTAIVTTLLSILLAPAALAGQPRDGQIMFQEAASPVMERIDGFHDGLLILITVISALVLLLLLIVIFRFNRRANPTPSTNSHNTLLEVVWTFIPALILVVTFLFSFDLLRYIEQVPEDADVTIKATGYQWYWGYSYPDEFGDEEFTAVMLEEDELAEDAFGDPQPRLLATDFDVVVPVNKTIRMQITAADVIHSWAIPAFGVKMDGVPGRLNETWFKATKEGMFYGQCSELCGIKHAFMPIAVRVVSEAEYQQWVSEQKAEFGIADDKNDDGVRGGGSLALLSVN